MAVDETRNERKIRLDDDLADGLFLVGATLVVLGIALVSIAAAFIAAGLALIGVGVGLGVRRA